MKWKETVCDEPNQDDYDYQQKASSGGEATSCREVWHYYNYTGSENITEDMMCAGWLAGGMGNCQV